jgi:hypothetical protein
MGTDNNIAMDMDTTWPLTHNTAQMCLENNYVFENTHTSGFQIAYVLGELIQRCGNGNGQVATGNQNLNGDSGLNTMLYLQGPNDGCGF